ncbi:MAG: steroid C27-monooxygenase [Acidimicrobiales bacterium]|nr:steroid C27-monooxygenase [Acidimicrobiales bacterium]
MACPVQPGTDFTDPDTLVSGVPLPEFAYLRENAPMFWNPQTRANSSYDDGGFWLATRHADVKAISCAREGWSSAENTAIVKFDGATVGPDERVVQRQMLLNMDDPQHSKVRGIVSRGVFTPRGVGKIEDALRERAVRIVIEAKAKGTGNFVDDVACELPLQALADLMGFPQEDRKQIFNWSNQMMAYDDPDYDVDPSIAAAEILGYAMTLGEERKACPADDIITRLVAASTTDDILTSEEFGFFVLILAVAGNETTRNAISHGMHAFLQNPEQWELYKAERPSTTADEIVRWATPVVMFQRTAMDDVEVSGTEVKKGQRVGLVYSSANFDDTVFEDPHRFDITRDPNPHVGFGGGGAHFCVGANLAKVEIDLMFNAIADHLPDITQLGEPTRLRSGWLHALKEFPVSYG